MENNLHGENINDHLTYVLICGEDGTIMVDKKVNNGNFKYSLISITLKQNEGWNEAGRRLARQV